MTITLNLAAMGRLSDETFQQLCSQHPELRLERSAKGELILMPPAGGETSQSNGWLTYRLFRWAESHPELGVAFDSSAAFKLPSGAIRGPDAAWVERSRWDGLSFQSRRGFPPVCPDFVVELLSPSDSLREVREKMLEYRECGARLGWLLDPFRQTAEIYRPDREVESVANPDALSGEDVLPDFTLDLKGIL